MKTILLPILVPLALCAQSLDSDSRYQEATRLLGAGLNHRVFEQVSVDPGGTAVTNRVVQLASGWNWLNPATDQYEESQVNFVLAPDGSAVISRAQTKVIVSPNLNNPKGALDLETLEGRRIRGTFVGITLFDAATGRQVQIAAVKDSIGQLVAPNVVLFPDCAEGLAADLRIVYERGELHHDLILKQRIAASALERLGFSAETSRLEVWTEFFEADQPVRTVSLAKSESDPELRQSLIEPDLVDEALDFGALQLATGRAYAVDSAASGSVTVGKQWIEAEGRRFVVESCDWADLDPLLEALPEADLHAMLDRDPEPEIDGIADASDIARRSAGIGKHPGGRTSASGPAWGGRRLRGRQRRAFWPCLHRSRYVARRRDGHAFNLRRVRRWSGDQDESGNCRAHPCRHRCYVPRGSVPADRDHRSR
jgi:hypothetical protein